MAYRSVIQALFLLALHCGAVHAEEAGKPLFSVNGFGTMGLVHSSETRADFVGSLFQPSGVGHTKRTSADVDSKIGLQLDVSVSTDLSAVLQIVSQHTSGGGYFPQVEWANVKYKFTPDFSVRLGRTALSSAFLSEVRMVGYASPWVRPPVEVYMLLPLTHKDGVDASYQFSIDDVKSVATVSYGQSTATSPFGRVTGTNMLEVGNVIEYGNGTLKLGHSSIDLLGLQFRTLAAGVNYDSPKWLLMLEWVKASNSIGPGASAWQLTAGHRIGKFTPYLTYARLKPESMAIFPGGPPSADQSTISAGVRWDIAKNVALKFQFDHTSLRSGSAGLLTNLQPNFQPGGKVNLLSATVDFVF